MERDDYDDAGSLFMDTGTGLAGTVVLISLSAETDGELKPSAGNVACYACIPSSRVFIKPPPDEHPFSLLKSILKCGPGPISVVRVQGTTSRRTDVLH